MKNLGCGEKLVLDWKLQYTTKRQALERQKRAHRLPVAQAFCMNKYISLNIKFLNEAVHKCNCWIHLTILNKPNSTNISSEKAAGCRSCLKSLHSRGHESTPWKITFSDTKPSSAFGVMPFICKASGSFISSTTKQETSHKTEVTWNLFLRNLLAFLSSPHSGMLFNIRTFPKRFP